MIKRTSEQKYINDVLHLARIKRKERAKILAYLDTPEKQDAMVVWLSKNPGAAAEEIAAKAEELGTM